MMEDGVKGIGSAGNFRVMELIELVAESMAIDATGHSESDQDAVGDT
jgi:hypothetical protein